MNQRECFEKRLLRRESPSPERCRRSVEVAEAKLLQAGKALEHELFDASLILSYTAMFHAARALLYRDGVIEKSHVCLIEYLRESYVKKGRISEAHVNALDSARVDRHETLYGLETASSRRDAEYRREKAADFLTMVKTMLTLK